MAFSNDRMNPFRPVIHEVDTRRSSDVTIFDGSQGDETKLAKQFWTSVLLTPPVESTLVCKEIKQRVRSRTLNDGKSQRRFSTSPMKKPTEKTDREKEHDQLAVLHQMRDEAQQIETNYQRHRQLRELFYQQSQMNRCKKERWALPPSRTYLNPNDTLDPNEKIPEDEDRQLVRSLPD